MIYLAYLLNVTPISAIDNVSISPEKIYLISRGRGYYEADWVLGVKLENEGSKPQMIKYNDFKLEDQYGWKYRPKGFTSYNPNADYADISEESTRDPKLNLLSGEAMRIGLIFEKISALSEPHALVYMNQSIKMDKVTSKVLPQTSQGRPIQ